MMLLQLLVGCCLTFSVIGFCLEWGSDQDDSPHKHWSLLAATFLIAFCATCLFIMIKFSK